MFIRAWQNGAGKLLLLYLILLWVPAIYELLTGGSGNIYWIRAFVLFLLSAFLSWRVWRGGRISFAIMLLLSIYGVVVDLIATVWPWDASVVLNLVSDLGQLAILLSPAVRNNLGHKTEVPASQE
jgi:hypothetical protein